MANTPDQEQAREGQGSRSPRHRSPQSVQQTGLPFSVVDLEHLERIAPGTTARLIDAYLEERIHQRAVEVRGQHYALISALAGLLVALIAFVVGALTNHAAASIGGGVIGVVDLVALVTAFLTGRGKG